MPGERAFTTAIWKTFAVFSPFLRPSGGGTGCPLMSVSDKWVLVSNNSWEFCRQRPGEIICFPLSFLSLFLDCSDGVTLKHSVIPLFSQELLAYSWFYLCLHKNSMSLERKTKLLTRAHKLLEDAAVTWVHVLAQVLVETGSYFSACSLAVTLVWNCRLQQRNYWPGEPLKQSMNKGAPENEQERKSRSQRSISLSLILNFPVIWISHETIHIKFPFLLFGLLWKQ